MNSDQLRTALVGGLVPAVPVTFDRDGRFHPAAHEAYVAHMTKQPIAGVAVWAHTGRGLHLDADTARRVIGDWHLALSDKPLIAGVGSRRKEADPKRATEETLAMASVAAEYGADALLVYPPVWLRQHDSPDKLIVDHHAQLSQIGLPLVLFYLYEAAGGVRYNRSVLDDLLSLPNVVGIKMATLDSVMTFQDVARQIQARHPDKLLITGEDRFLGYSLRLGARTALVGLGAVCTEVQTELLSAHFTGNATRFLELSDSIDRLAEVLFIDPMEGYIGRVLRALAHLEIIPGEAAYDPWGPQLRETEIATIIPVLNTLTASCLS
ncbi:MAG: dihydrodipicolinate synthase family protein [Blastocatellia bacterium]|nr:MAG: dihydrodipicolinate synthase family protein [Blastocatellia bacterium]